MITTATPPPRPAPVPIGDEPVRPAPSPVTTPDGRRLEPSSMNVWATRPTTPASRAASGAVTLAEAGLDSGEYARFTNVGESGDAWQVLGTPRADRAIPLPGSFKDAVAAAQALADSETIGGIAGRSYAHNAYAIVAGPADARHAVELRGYLKPDRLYGEDNVQEVFVTDVRPEVEAIISKKHWIDLRSDAPDEVHEPDRLRVLPIIGPVI